MSFESRRPLKHGHITTHITLMCQDINISDAFCVVNAGLYCLPDAPFSPRHGANV